MFETKLYFKSKEFILTMIVLSLLTTTNIYMYFRNSVESLGLNRFAFWNYVTHYDLGSILMFLSPLLISFLSISILLSKMNGNYFKAMLTKSTYKKTLISEVLKAYLKGWFPFAFVSIIVFLIGIFALPSNIVNAYADQYTNFSHVGINSPYVFVILSVLLLLEYSMLITNVALVSMYITKKINICILSTLIFTNALNFIIGNFSIITAKIIGTKEAIKYAHSINIYEGYFVQSNLINSFVHTSIYLILSVIVVFFVFQDKERVVRNFE